MYLILHWNLQAKFAQSNHLRY